MSRINGSADTTFPMLIFLGGLIGYLVVDFFWLRRPHKDRKVPLTRGRIIYLVWGVDALRMGVLAMALSALPALAFLYGRMGIGGLTGSICLMLIIAATPILARLRWLRSVLPIIHGKRHIPLPENAELENTDGTWFYQDKDWYIRLGKDVYALLYAPKIDFKSPNSFRFSRELGMKGGIYFDHYRYEDKGGGSCYVRHPKDARIEAWVRRHGGRFL